MNSLFLFKPKFHTVGPSMEKYEEKAKIIRQDVSYKFILRL